MSGPRKGAVLFFQVKRNRERFPEDFAFQLTPEEVLSVLTRLNASEGGGRWQTFEIAICDLKEWPGRPPAWLLIDVRKETGMTDRRTFSPERFPPVYSSPESGPLSFAVALTRSRTLPSSGAK
ncbi:MAG: ORF6N domain-containing protein [Bdellovibrionota bacterium]